MEKAQNASTPDDQLDAVIIGAGVAGLYQLHQLRQLGMRAIAVDAADDVGGTWYWNRYPGARFDSESYIYQYLFDEDLYKDWTWSERFPAQPEIERWMHYIADRLELREHLRFGRKVTQAIYDEDTARWTVKTDRGDEYTPQFVVACTGMLSAPLEDRFPGQKDFEGRIFHTARWPQEGIDLSGQKVGVVGVGATGIQVIQTIAPTVESLKVFIRTPQYVLPMKNPKYGPKDVAAYKARFDELKSNLPTTFTGFEYDFEKQWANLSESERREHLEACYADGSLKLWLASFGEMFFDDDVNEQISEMVREKMRARLKDPKLIELLVPTSYGFGSHRVPLETNYLEVYHRDNVEAVGVKNNPIERILPKGIQLADGTVHEVDVIILAVGFDAGSGALARIDVQGRGGRKLAEEWSQDLTTSLGLAKHGYPNLFMTGAPLAPSAALCNMTTCLQQQTEWITQCIEHVRRAGRKAVEPTAAFEKDWVDHHDAQVAATVFAHTDSWYNGANVEGKPRRFLSYVGGVGTYRDKCQEVIDREFGGFQLS